MMTSFEQTIRLSRSHCLFVVSCSHEFIQSYRLPQLVEIDLSGIFSLFDSLSFSHWNTIRCKLFFFGSVDYISESIRIEYLIENILTDKFLWCCFIISKVRQLGKDSMWKIKITARRSLITMLTSIIVSIDRSIGSSFVVLLLLLTNDGLMKMRSQARTEDRTNALRMEQKKGKRVLWHLSLER